MLYSAHVSPSISNDTISFFFLGEADEREPQVFP